MVQTQVHVDTDKIKTRVADDRGRVRLGPDYAGEEVEVAILDADDHDHDDSDGSTDE